MNAQKVYDLLYRLAGTRRRRMARFEATMAPDDTTTIVDLGGTLPNWAHVAGRPHLTLVNADPWYADWEYPDHVRFELGDASALDVEDSAYDVAYSNSVIEHLGNWETQQRFAAEALRVGKRVWVQTPAREFFFEHHLMAPFVHWLPIGLQRRLVRLTPWAWIHRPSREMADDLIDELRLLTRDEMVELFPGCQLIVERFLGLPRSYIAYRTT